MLRLTLAFCLCVYSTTGVSLAQSSRNMLAREFVANIARQDFVDMASRIDGNVSEDERENAINGLKLMEYNRAYGAYACLVADRSFDEAVAKACESKFLSEYSRFIQVGERVIVPSRVAECEVRHRLHDAEGEFPPFEFLQGEHTQLFDLAKMADCLTK
jgi:hypothetical protein